MLPPAPRAPLAPLPPVVLTGCGAPGEQAMSPRERCQIDDRRPLGVILRPQEPEGSVPIETRACRDEHHLTLRSTIAFLWTDLGPSWETPRGRTFPVGQRKEILIVALLRPH